MIKITQNRSKKYRIATDALEDVVNGLFPMINLNNARLQFLNNGRVGIYDVRQDNVPLRASINLIDGTIADGEAELKFQVVGYFPSVKSRSYQALARVTEYMDSHYSASANSAREESYAS